MDGWMDGCMNEWIHEWIDEWMDECMSGWVPLTHFLKSPPCLTHHSIFLTFVLPAVAVSLFVFVPLQVLLHVLAFLSSRLGILALHTLPVTKDKGNQKKN